MSSPHRKTTTRRPDRVLVSGWYGNGNLGDEAILMAICGAVHAVDDNVSLSFLTDDVTTTETLHGVHAIDRKRTFKYSRTIKELAALARHDVFVLGGGGLVRDFGSGPQGIESWLRPLRYAQSLRKRTMTYAVGADRPRFRESAENIKRTLTGCNIVTVRDVGSAMALRELDVQAEVLVTADPAIMLGEGTRRSTRSERPRIAVSLRGWYTNGRWVDYPERVDTALSELALALDALAAEFDVEIVFVPFQNHGADRDLEVCRAVAQRMSHRNAIQVMQMPAHPRVAIDLFANCDLVVGMRLHSLIFATSVGTPVFGLDYSPKVRKFLEHVGVPHACADLTTASTPGVLAAELRSAYLNRGDTRAALERTVPPLRELAILNGVLLSALARDDRDSVEVIVQRIRNRQDPWAASRATSAALRVVS